MLLLIDDEKKHAYMSTNRDVLKGLVGVQPGRQRRGNPETQRLKTVDELNWVMHKGRNTGRIIGMLGES